MSQAGVSIRLERKLKPRPRLVAGFEGEALWQWYAQADETARRLGLESLGSLSSANAHDRELAGRFAAMAGRPAEPAMAQVPVDRWYEPSEGLRTVRGLMAYLRDHPEAMDGATSILGGAFPDFEGGARDAVLTDLGNLERELKAAEEQGVRFAFCVS